MKNCANYGSLTRFGSNFISIIGGIVGYSYDGLLSRVEYTSPTVSATEKSHTKARHQIDCALIIQPSRTA